MKVTRIRRRRRRLAIARMTTTTRRCSARNLAGPAEQPRSADRSARLRPRAVQGLRLEAIRRAAKSASTIRRSSTPSSIRSSNGGRVDRGSVRRSVSAGRKRDLRSGQPGQHRSRRHPRRAPSAGQGRLHRLQSLLDRARDSDEGHLPARHSAQRAAAIDVDRQPAAGVVEHQPPAKHRPWTRPTSSPASRDPATGSRLAATRCRCSTPASSARSVRRCTCARTRVTT